MNDVYTCTLPHLALWIGMANTKPITLPKNFVMRADEEFYAMLDDLRALERPVPDRAPMVRALVREAWEARCKKGKR